MEKPIGFHSLPVELRLRILNNTHLGPPETGGYDPRLQCLRVRDGRIIPRHHPMLEPPPWTICSSPSTHSTSKPECQCRILPTQLFLVDKQMYREAFDVFYSSLHLDMYQDDPAITLTFLRDVLPPQGLHRLRRLEFTMTEAQCEGWASGAVASGYPAEMLEGQVANPYWGGGPPPSHNYRADWRALVELLAARADVPRLALTVNMSECAWAFIEDTLMWEDPPDVSMFRFIYDFYVDVTAALCALRGLGSLTLELSAFAQLRPWLEREVLGHSTGEPTFDSPLQQRRWQDLWRRPRFYQVIPPWHDVDRRLEGSNYHPD